MNVDPNPATQALSAAEFGDGQYDGPPLQYKSPPRADSIANPKAAYKVLDDFLCAPNPHPVVVGVTDPNGNYPGHFVLVYAKEDRPDGSFPALYRIFDTGFGRTNRTNTLDDYKNGNTLPKFQTRGAVTDPTGDFSSITVDVGTPATLLVVDPAGLRTGFDPATGTSPQDIANSAYNENLITNIATGDVGSVQHLVQILQPASGNYQLIVSGKTPGSYTMLVSPFSQDGIAEPAVTIPGIAGVGTTATFQVQLATAPGSMSQVTRYISKHAR